MANSLQLTRRQKWILWSLVAAVIALGWWWPGDFDIGRLAFAVILGCLVGIFDHSGSHFGTAAGLAIMGVALLMLLALTSQDITLEEFKRLLQFSMSARPRNSTLVDGRLLMVSYGALLGALLRLARGIAELLKRRG